MSISLNIQPDEIPISWEKFCMQRPPFSIALDGYVSEPPCFDEAGPRINFNHHEKVDRLATRSTCSQVLIAIRQGLFDLFRDKSGPKAEVFVNDCDEDVCLSWFLLKNYKLVENDLPLELNRLVAIEDLMDATAGAYPFPVELSELHEVAWVFDPYRRFRIEGGLERKNIDEFQQIIDNVALRIEQHIRGAGGSIDLDTRYKRIGGGKNWAMIEEEGTHARTGAYLDGIRAYVSVRKYSNTHYVYTIGRMAPFIPFDIAKMVKALNEREGCRGDRWGGANTIGGSPRVKGSKLPPQEVEKIIGASLCKNSRKY